LNGNPLNDHEELNMISKGKWIMPVILLSVIFLQIDVYPSAFKGEKVALAAIDIQSYYIEGAKDSDLKQTLIRIGRILKTASDYEVPFFITYEYLEQRPLEEHMKILPEHRALLPEHNIYSYVKTAFDASRQPEFFKDLKHLGIKKVILCGAETDVCVLQTALGLRARKFEVYVVNDAVYTSEYDEYPAFKRLCQAGIRLISTSHLLSSIKNNQPLSPDIEPLLPEVKSRSRSIIHPLHTAVLLSDYQQKQIDECVNPSKKSILARYDIFCYTVDAFRVPLFTMTSIPNPSDFPEGFFRPRNLKFYRKTIFNTPEGRSNFQQELQKRDIRQIFLAGVFTGRDLINTVRELKKYTADIYIIQDMILSPDANIKEVWNTLYSEGIIPMTFKMYNYGLIKSVNYREAHSIPYMLDMWEYYKTKKITTWVEELPRVIY
jgi:nicotinamidase-related amidase